MTDRAQWQRVKALFQTLVERPEEAWEPGLRGLEPEDSTLAAEVRALLEAHREGGGKVAAALRQESERLTCPAAEPDRGGQRVGAYRLLRSLGEGGMGEVWLAERADDAFHKRVAVKLVRRALFAPEAFERFRTEREALARLEHPNIVRLLDGGTTADGVPYFVMEYVEGEPIERYCGARALPLEARLNLFAQVCSAVERAHGNLIVHRDIKPSNVLVTADGTAKLLDFGIAKLLDPEPGSHLLTRTSIPLATPAFASPEQLAGGPVTTATDVYALGILLYRLLTGRHPYAFPSEHITEVARVVRDAAPSRPSQAAALPAVVGSPAGGDQSQQSQDGSESQESRLPLPSLAARRAWCRQLRGDLDNIAMTALRKEPTRRYSSVALLGADVESYLRGLPVSATPDSLRYRAGKFARRHRLALAAAAAAVLSLCALSAVALWQARRAAEQARVARAEQRKAEAVSSFLQGVLGAADTAAALLGRKAGSGVTVADVLADAAARAGREFAGQPDVEAKVRMSIAASDLSLGLYKPAIEQYSLAVAEAFAGHPLPHPDRAFTLHGLAKTEYMLGLYEQAESTYRRTLREYSRLAELPAAVRHSPMSARHDLSLLLSQRGRWAEAEVLERQAIADLGSQVGAGHPAEAIMLGRMGDIRANRGDLAESERFYRQSLAAFAALRIPAAASAERGWSSSGLCTVLRLRDRLAEAEATCEEARRLLERALGRQHPLYAAHEAQLGVLAHRQGQVQRAEDLLRDALAVQRKAFPAGHSMIAKTDTLLGQVLVARGKLREGEAMLRDSLAIRRSQLPAADWRVGETASALGDALLQEGRAAEAGPLLREGYETLRAALGESFPYTLAARRRLAQAAAR